MNRRQFIGLIGITTMGSAGCVQSPGTGAATPTDEQVDTDSRFEELPCPSFAEADRTVCSHTLTGQPPEIYVAPSTELFEPTTTVETIEFVLHNRASESLGLNPYAWELHERTDTGWSFLAPESYVEPWYNLSSGETYTWQLSMEPRSSPTGENPMAIVEDLPTGIYAFQIAGILQSDSGGDTNIECIALFEVRREG